MTRRRARRLRGVRLTALLAALAMLGPFATDSYLPALPNVARAFGVSDEAAQKTLSAYLMGYAAMTLLYGTLSDAFGQRPVIVGALALFTLALAGAAASHFALDSACHGARARGGRHARRAALVARQRTRPAQTSSRHTPADKIAVGNLTMIRW
ncbi:MFS transporter [Paraburkholderia sp. SIMBA_027]|uniref:MFS transporter n=1 Tax=Paraburkholderia sp. SIMBA_027 TaxID=3085770 RepID=UPI003979AE9D